VTRLCSWPDTVSGTQCENQVADTGTQCAAGHACPPVTHDSVNRHPRATMPGAPFDFETLAAEPGTVVPTIQTSKCGNCSGRLQFVVEPPDKRPDWHHIGPCTPQPRSWPAFTPSKCPFYLQNGRHDFRTMVDEEDDGVPRMDWMGGEEVDRGRSFVWTTCSACGVAQ
jgi:hypothetical protein